MDAFVLTFPVKNRADVLTAHEGEELSFVLQGEILFQLGDEKIALKTGDCLYFNAEIPHMGKNVGRVDAKVLMVAAPGRGPGREYGWWKAPGPAATAPPRRARRSSRTRRDP
jgi:quercetin dioxygenase-like cupin family protein